MKKLSNIALIVMLMLSWCGVAFSQQRSLLRFPEKTPTLTPQQQHYLGIIAAERTTNWYTFVEVDIEALQQQDAKIDVELVPQHMGHLSATLQNTGIETWHRDNWAWTGSVADVPFSIAHFVYRKGNLRGKIAFSGQTFTIRTLGEGMHILVAVNPDAKKEGCHEMVETPEKTAAKEIERETHFDKEAGTNNKSLAGNCRIRLLVVYTDDASANYADPLGDIQDAVVEFNQINSNSAVSVRMELACVEEITYTESGDANTDLANFKDTNDGQIDGIHALREIYDADMCCLVCFNFNDWAGYADDIGATYSTAFQVTEYDNMLSGYTFTHEFGHLLNCRHDPYVDDTAGSNHGYVRQSSLWRTIMAYNDQCSDDGDNCPRIPYWSNPGITYLGNATGVTNANDNESAIEAYDDDIAGLEAFITNKILAINDGIANDEAAYVIAQTSISTTAVINYFSGSEGSYTAASYITLAPGFSALAGTTFSAVLDNCTENFLTGNDQPVESLTVPDGNAFEVASAEALNVSPNPARDQFNIRYQAATEGIYTIQLLGISGNLVANIAQQHHYDSDTYTVLFDCSDLPSGVYFVRLVHPNGVLVSRVTKASN